MEKKISIKTKFMKNYLHGSKLKENESKVRRKEIIMIRTEINEG